MGHRSGVRTLAGLVVLTAGLITLIDRLGGTGTTIDLVEQWWPVPLLALGIVNLSSFIGEPFKRQSGLSLPLIGLVIFLTTASVTLLATTHSLPSQTYRYVLPLVMISLGVTLTIATAHTDRVHRTWIAESAILRRVRLASQARGIYNIKVWTVMGEVALDLTGATLKGTVELHASAWGGRIRLLVPAGWMVEKRWLAGPAVEVEIASVPDNLRRAHRATLSISLLGAYGHLSVQWGEPAANL